MLTEPHCPENPPARLCSRPLPPYRYIPGINFHPVRDPNGHSFGKTEIKPAFMEPTLWQQNHDYLFGVDLYNRAYWWEAHEAWESIWHTTDKSGAYGQYLQGLIQIAAAFIKWHSHERVGMEKLYQIGLGRLTSVARENQHFMGLDLHCFVTKLNNHFKEVLESGNFSLNPILNYPFLLLNTQL